jgi:DNA-binding PadR family transcriptional regulator
MRLEMHIGSSTDQPVRVCHRIFFSIRPSQLQAVLRLVRFVLYDHSMAVATSLAVTPLGYALLCEIRREPRSGYALRRVFETTPLGIFSGSPGSIYPALKRLQGRRLTRAVGSGRGGRFEITRSGHDVVEAWLARPVTAADVSRGPDLELCLLRFAFLQGHSERSRSLRFLKSFASAAKARETELAAFLESDGGRALPIHGRLAVEHGLRSSAASAQWAIDALGQLTNERRGVRG